MVANRVPEKVVLTGQKYAGEKKAHSGFARLPEAPLRSAPCANGHHRLLLVFMAKRQNSGAVGHARFDFSLA